MPLFRHTLFALTLLAMLLGRVQPAGAADLPFLDIDSLVYASSNIVDGTIVASPQPRPHGILDFQIERSYRGDLAVGKTIHVASLDLYRLEGMFNPARFLAPGAHLFLFLYHAPPQSYLSDCLWPVPSGVKWLDAGVVKSFRQMSNPGPYEVGAPVGEACPGCPSAAQYRRDLAEAMQRVAPIEPLLHRNATADDIPALLAILRQRAARETNPYSFRRDTDAIGIAVCGRLRILAIPSAIAKAIECNPRWGSELAIYRPEVRDYLMGAVADAGQPEQRRIACAQNLETALGIWNGSPLPDSLDRLLALAGKTAASPEVCAQVLEQARDLLGREKRDETHSNEKLTVPSFLNKLYNDTKSERLRYAVERIVYDYDPAAYGALHSPCGQVISFVGPAQCPGQPASITYEGYARYLDGLTFSQVDTKLILRQRETGRRREVPAGLSTNWWGVGDEHFMVAHTPIPLDLPHGRYLLFAEFYRKGKLVGTSHYWELVL